MAAVASGPAVVLTVTLPVLAPSGITSGEPTTDARAFELVTGTLKPPAGALQSNVTIAVVLVPPMTSPGFRAIEKIRGALSVKPPWTVTASRVAEIVPWTFADTSDVWMANVAVF
jgi:hypothetical protein